MTTLFSGWAGLGFQGSSNSECSEKSVLMVIGADSDMAVKHMHVMVWGCFQAHIHCGRRGIEVLSLHAKRVCGLLSLALVPQAALRRSTLMSQHGGTPFGLQEGSNAPTQPRMLQGRRIDTDATELHRAYWAGLSPRTLLYDVRPCFNSAAL